jgi:hypothetical protein
LKVEKSVDGVPSRERSNGMDQTKFDWQQSKRELATAVSTAKDAATDARYFVKRVWLARPNASYTRKWIMQSVARFAFALAVGGLLACALLAFK